MNTIYKTVLLCGALWALVSCGKTPDPVTPDPEQPAEGLAEIRTLIFVLPDAGDAALKQAWVAGDQIVVHGEYAKDQVTVTLSAGDISADGKTATKTVDGLKPYRRDDCSSVLYASYPASVVDNLKHCFFYSKFSTTNEQILAASNSGDNFYFQNICGLLSMEVGGGYDGYRLSTPKKEALGYEFMQVKLTDKDQNFRQYVGDPILQIDGKPEGGKIAIFIPGDTQLKSGLVLKLQQGGIFNKIFRLAGPLDIERGAVLDLGDITAELEDYDDPFSSDILDLDAEGNANCYIVKAPGTFKFKAVVGNKPTQYLEDVASADVLWETWNNAAEVEEGSVVESASYAEDYVIVHLPSPLVPGNAVVAARAEDGTILWSWHIWVPATAIQTGNYGGIMGDDLMDRNLGALKATVASDAEVDPVSYGLMYQWGRKDPFTAAGAFKSSTPATWVGEDDEVAPGQISLEESIAFPRRLGHVDNGDWLMDTNDELWVETEKTIYDPCPPGYRVPKPVSGTPFWSGDLTAEAGWKANVAAGWFQIGAPDAAVFPIAGYRDDYGVDSMAKVGVRTLYWVSRGSGSSGSGANLRSDSGYKFGSAPKARLGSVRCTVE